MSPLEYPIDFNLYGPLMSRDESDAFWDVAGILEDLLENFQEGLGHEP